MTVAFPDSPGDCPTGMNRSVSSCAEGAGAPRKSGLIPTTARTNVRTVIRLPSRPSVDKERSRSLLISDRLLRVLPSEEYTPDGLVCQPSCLLEVGDGVGVKAAAAEHPDAVVGLVNRAVEKPPSLRGGRHGEARLQSVVLLGTRLAVSSSAER